MEKWPEDYECDGQISMFDDEKRGKAMNVKPILFNTEMVQAILDGRKTVTRRLIKPQPDSNHQNPLGWCTSSTDIKDVGKFMFGIDEYGSSIQSVKPKYQIEDILWVRETWCGATDGTFRYKAGINENTEKIRKAFGVKWHPSIHMPKEAARIFLRVTDVRVEKLHDITDKQAIKEGFEGEICTHINRGEYGGCTDCMNTGWIEPPQVGFMYMWDSTVKNDSEKWSANPWVWVISFERCEKQKGWCRK